MHQVGFGPPGKVTLMRLDFSVKAIVLAVGWITYAAILDVFGG